MSPLLHPLPTLKSALLTFFPKENTSQDMACACQDGGGAATPSPFKGPGTEPGHSERLVTWDLQGVTLGTIMWLPRFLSQSAYFGSQFEGTLFTTVGKA